MAEGKAHILTEKRRDKVHEIGRQLVTGNTPVGKGLETVQGTPQHLLGPKGITKTDEFHMPEHIEEVYISGQEHGWIELFNHYLDSTPDILSMIIM